MSSLNLSEYTHSFILGLVQGFSEFLPISSSGHLVLLNFFLKVSNFDLFLILVLHLGTLMAILSYYRKPLWNILKDFLANPFSLKEEGGWVYLTAVGLLPGILGAFAFKPLLEKSLDTMSWTGGGFFLTGILLFSTRFKPENPMDFSFIKKSTALKTAFLIGMAQTLAFFPGISRSGWTIAIALFLKWPKKQAVFFSFLLAIPAILGGSVFEWIENPPKKDFSIGTLSLAFFSSWFFGHLALKGLIHSLKKDLFPYFAFYLWILGAGTLFLFKGN